jgi:hypothetical protein
MSLLDKYKSVSNVDQDLLDIEESNKPKGTFLSEEERAALYFSIMLPKGKKEVNKTIRIISISPDEPGTWFKKEWYHEMEVNKQKTKIYDPHQDGELSPLREIQQSLYAEGSEASKELAKKYRASEYYILRIIDRDAEHEGPKFWRIKKNSKGEGAFDKILGAIKYLKSKNRSYDIANPFNGRDLDLTISLVESNYGGNYSSVTNAVFDDEKPLHEDQETMLSWLEDTKKTLRVAFPKKPLEFIEIVAAGGEPKWDKELKKYIDSTLEAEAEDVVEEAEEKVTKVETTKPKTTAKKTNKVVVAEPTVDESVEESEPDSDDLPF